MKVIARQLRASERVSSRVNRATVRVCYFEVMLHQLTIYNVMLENNIQICRPTIHYNSHC